MQALLLEYAFFNTQVTQHWGGEGSFLSEKAYVKYLDDYLSRAKIDFEKGILIVETLASSELKKQLKNAIIAALLTPDDPAAVDIYSANSVKIKGKPFLLGRILDQEGKAIEYLWRANNYAQYLLGHQLRIDKQGQENRYWVSIKLVNDHKMVAAKGIKAGWLMPVIALTYPNL